MVIHRNYRDGGTAELLWPRTIAEEMMPSRLKIELNKIEPIILCANRLRANNSVSYKSRPEQIR
ncbi:hypothetical protein OUZ56_017456 [Daphnia magna]|uniref:Uncharacterized protein n=1 Tax=Daphnia magna TaxID=35525 RepID=A0ABR0ASV1_9CRUS|nr:hypothetical protein OUZ56_017456 [Daphnia magna]